MVYIELFTIFILGLFAGANIYISLVEIPARRAMNPEIQIICWKEFVPRALFILKNSGIFAMILCIICSILTQDYLWYVITILNISLGPYTAIIIAPINRQLIEADRESGDFKKLETLIQNWAKRHNIRTMICFFAFVLSILTLY